MRAETLEMTMLFDFYGELLTEKQREYFDLRHNEDLSLAEIAENVGITRQGVFDIVARAEATLRDAEAKTGLIRRFGELRDGIAEARALAARLPESAVAARLLAVLDGLKG
jgi:predicted DNA-binding protein YlxM (UPF0122 family)